MGQTVGETGTRQEMRLQAGGMSWALSSRACGWSSVEVIFRGSALRREGRPDRQGKESWVKKGPWLVHRELSQAQRKGSPDGPQSLCPDSVTKGFAGQADGCGPGGAMQSAGAQESSLWQSGSRWA